MKIALILNNTEFLFYASQKYRVLVRNEKCPLASYLSHSDCMFFGEHGFARVPKHKSLHTSSWTH